MTDKSFRKSGIIPVFLFLILIILAVFLRTWHFSEKGLFFHDQGVYATQSKFLAKVIAWPWAKERANESLKNHLIRTGSSWPGFAKPGYEAIIAFFFLMGGINDRVFLGAGIFFNLLLLITVFIFLWRFFSPEAALAGAGILAVSKYQVIYSLNGLADMTSSFFVFAGLFLYCLYDRGERKRTWQFYLSALVLGYAFTMNYKLFFVPPLVFLYEIYYTFSQKLPWDRKIIGRLIVYLICLVIPVLAFQLPFLISAKLFGLGSEGPYLTYFGQLAFYFQNGTNAYYPTFSRIFAYPIFLWYLEGPLVFILFTSGTCWLIVRWFKNKEYLNLILAVQIILPFILWSLVTGGDPSTKPLAAIYPFLAVAGGIFLSEAVKMFRQGKVLYYAILILIVVVGSFWVMPVLKVKTSGLREAVKDVADYVRVHGGKVTADHPSLGPAAKFYIGEEAEKDPDGFGKHVFFATPDIEGDIVIVSGKLTPHPEYERFINKIEGLKPVLEIKNPVMDGSCDPFLRATNPLPYLLNRKIEEKNNLLIYDLRQKEKMVNWQAN